MGANNAMQRTVHVPVEARVLHARNASAVRALASQRAAASHVSSDHLGLFSHRDCATRA